MPRTTRHLRLRSLSADDFSWLSDAVRRSPLPLSATYSPIPAARRQLGLGIRPTISEFILRIPVTDGSGKGLHYFSLARYPYQAEVVELLNHPAVKIGVLTGGNQSAKTGTIEILLLWRACYDPIETIIYYPDRDTVRDKFSNSLIPKLSHRNFGDLLTGAEDDMSSELIRLANGMSIKAGWTSSLMRLSAKSAGIVILEEAEKNAAKAAESEAAIEYLATGRTRDYGADGKLIYCSTLAAAGGLVARKRQQAAAVFDWLACCPGCLELQRMSTTQLTDSGTYRCLSCGNLWSETDRCTALAAGALRARAAGWQNVKPAEIQHDPRPLADYMQQEWPASVAVSIPSLVLPTVPLKDIVAARTAARNDINARHYYVNHHLDNPFSLSAASRSTESILRRTWGQPRLVVPPAESVSYVLCGVDVQHRSIYYWIQAFGWPSDSDGNYSKPASWMIDAGQVDTTAPSNLSAALSQLEELRFLDAAGNTERRPGRPWKIDAIICDLRGKNAAATEALAEDQDADIPPIAAEAGDQTYELKAWAARSPGTRWLHWGSGHDIPGSMYSLKQLPGRQRYVLADRSKLVAWREAGLSCPPGAPGCIYVNDDCTVEQAEHLLADELDHKSDRWRPIKARRRDYGDALRMAILLFHVLSDLTRRQK